MSSITWLEETGYTFPDVSTALREPDGLLAASEQLTPELVQQAYRRGIFPWYSPGQPVLWWSPDPRCVLYPGKFHVSRSFRRTLNRQPYILRTDTAFRDVMLACAEPREGQDGTWITAAMLEVYCRLHQQGYAHSIECWRNDELVGGMYGLALGDIFFGESMFSRQKDASKIAIHYLLTEIKPFMLDAQVASPHLLRLGAELIPREVFVRQINAHLDKPLLFQAMITPGKD